MNQKRYSKEEINFIVENFKNHTALETSKLFAEKFNKEIKLSAVQNINFRYSTTKKQIKKFFPEHIEFLKEQYKKHTIEECIKLLKEKFNLQTTEKSLRSILSNYKIYSERDTKFKTGHKLSPEQYEKCKSTMFKKGKKPFNAYSVGTEIDYKGYIYIKTNDELCIERGDWFKNWTPKSRLIYEQHHGPIPDGYQVIFADGNNRNFEIDNLILASKREICCMNREKLYIKNEAKLNKQTLTIAKLNLKIYDKKKEKKDAKKHIERFE